jgi:hypothetical protein
MKRRPIVKVLKGVHITYQWVRYGVNCALGAYRRDILVDGDPDCLGENICIFSIFSAKGRILRSTLSLLKAIRKEGYGLVLVVNGQRITRGWFEGEIGSADVVISRPNLGRDFAAYQFATNLILKRKLTIRRLLYCNDSVFYLDRNDSKNIFAHLISCNDDWVGMTETYERRYHVSSWCFQLSDKVLKTQAFVEFWKAYRPVDRRGHAIRQGEVGLSKTLLRAGYVPTVIFNAGTLLKAALQKHDIPNEKQLLQQFCTSKLERLSASGTNAVLKSLFQGEQLNQTNNLGILLISETGFPFIKKAMAFQSNCPISIIMVILEELMSGFCIETVNEVRLKGMRRTATSWKKLLFDAGVI